MIKSRLGPRQHVVYQDTLTVTVIMERDMVDREEGRGQRTQEAMPGVVGS